MPAEEFASVAPADFEEALRSWRYSQYDDYGNGNPECSIVPNALIKRRARASHRAARIWKGLEWSTTATNAYTLWIDEAQVATRTQNVAPPVAAPASCGETVRLHETVDCTRVREVQMMTPKARGLGLDLFGKLMHRELFSAEKPSVAQMTALLEILECRGCYVDFALWGSFHIRTAKSFVFGDSSSDLGAS